MILSTAPVVADLRGAHLHHGVAGAGAHRAGGRTRARAAAARGVAALGVGHGGDLDEDHSGAAPHQRAGHGQLGAEGEEEGGGEEEVAVAGHGGGGGECQVSAGRVTAGMVATRLVPHAGAGRWSQVCTIHIHTARTADPR